jgi:hypothetical protein
VMGFATQSQSQTLLKRAECQLRLSAGMTMAVRSPEKIMTDSMPVISTCAPRFWLPKKKVSAIVMTAPPNRIGHINPGTSPFRRGEPGASHFRDRVELMQNFGDQGSVASLRRLER